MACQINIASVVLSDSTLVINGNAQDCTKIQAKIVDAISTSIKESFVNPDGTWTIEFNESDIEDNNTSFNLLRSMCGQSIKIDSKCVEDLSCSGPSNFILSCSGCLDSNAVDISIDSQFCNNGSRNVRLKAQLPIINDGLFYEWEYGDGNSSDTAPLPPPDSVNVITIIDNPHAYMVSSDNTTTVTVKLKIFLSSGDICEYSSQLILDVCPPADCYDVTLRINNSNGMEIVNQECVQAGNYTVEVSNPSGGGYAYSWSVNGVPSPNSGNAIQIAIGVGEEKQISVAVLDGVCTVPGSVTLIECTDSDPDPEPVIYPVIDPIFDPVIDQVPPPSTRINWCGVALIILLVMLVVGVIATGLGFCGLGLVLYPPVSALLATTGYGILIAIIIMVIIIVIGLILLLFGTIGIIIWLFTCGTCRLNCFWIDILLSTLLTLSGVSAVLAFVGTIIAALNWSTICWVGWLISFVDVVLLYTFTLWFSRAVGCSTWPRWVPVWAKFTWPANWRFNCNVSGGE